ncbi:MAG TPA: ZIP family metal transporter [Candidatus Caccenecus avistercoris]|nr:ZIP family metal transporter [Candidatus Caccenecus avistercoris]
MNIALGLLLPFLGTTLGAACVYLLKDKLNSKLEKFFLGFASGVMIAASVWSLLIPSMDMALSEGIISWLPASIGFILGVLFLLMLDYIIPHLHKDAQTAEGPKSNLSKIAKLVLAVTLHNIPEGMAVGIVFASTLSQNITVSLTGALALSIGIAIQNFPEGAIISMPLKAEGKSKNKAFFYGVLSGIVEPIGAIITILLATMITPILPYFLAFAAGAMIYVVIEELIPDAKEGNHSNLTVIGVAFGFVLMMILDVALG